MNLKRSGYGQLARNSHVGRVFKLVLSIAATLAVAIECRALELSITNHSFETPVLGDGAGAFSVPGWAHVGTVQIYNPDNSFFAETTDGSPINPLNGSNAVGINSISASLRRATFARLTKPAPRHSW